MSSSIVEDKTGISGSQQCDVQVTSLHCPGGTLQYNSKLDENNVKWKSIKWYN